MAVSDTDERARGNDYVDRITLSRAIVAALLGGAAFGIPLQFFVGRMGAVGAMYNLGEPSIAIGWAAHMVHSVIFGAVFGMATEVDPLHSWMEESLPTATAVGIGFAMVLYLVNIMFIWPFWLGTVGFEPAMSWSIPYTPVKPVLGHLVFGVILGSVFHLLVDY